MLRRRISCRVRKPNPLDTAVRIESTRSRPPVRADQPDAWTVYDAAGLRVAEKVNDVWRFLIYDIGGKLVAEYGGVQATDEGGVKYVLQDWQGSTRAVVGNTGNVQSRSDYTAFGEPIGADTGLRTAAQGYGKSGGLRQGYALTERDDATGLDHTWFRKNENQAGRWTSPDPYNGSMSLGSPQSFNRYSYVENEPTNFVDPSGLNMQECGFRTLVISSCIEGEGCTIDDIQVIFVCTPGGGGGGNGPPIIDGGGGLGGATLPPWKGSGGGRKGECERIVAKIEHLMSEIDRELAKYDPVADFYGNQPYRTRGGKVGITKPKSHYNEIKGMQKSLNTYINRWKSLCDRDNFGDPPVVPLPQNAREKADQPVTAPYPRRISIWDMLPAPPSQKQVEEFYRRRGPVFPIVPRRIPVFP